MLSDGEVGAERIQIDHRPFAQWSAPLAPACGPAAADEEGAVARLLQGQLLAGEIDEMLHQRDHRFGDIDLDRMALDGKLETPSMAEMRPASAPAALTTRRARMLPAAVSTR